MSDSIPFRTATPAPVEAPVRDTVDSSKDSPQLRAGTSVDDGGPTPYVYEALEQKPYAIKFLGLGLYHNDPDFPDVRDQARALDQYVIKQAKAQGLKDSHASYKEVIDAIYKQIGKTPNEDPLRALKRLSVAAGALERLNQAKLQPILSAKTLTPTEFEELV